MRLNIIVMFLFLIVGFTAAFGQQAAVSAEDEIKLIKVSIMYPYAEGKTFDMAYYEDQHMPMVAGYLGSNLVKYSIEKGLSGGMPDAPMPYIAIGAFYVKNLAEYQSAIAPNIDAIRADFPNYTDIMPVIYISEIVR